MFFHCRSIQNHSFLLQKSGVRYKCSCCKIVCHTNCLSVLEHLKFSCKPTFRDVGVRSYREQTSTKHHWVHRRQQKGKCKACGKVSTVSNYIDNDSRSTYRNAPVNFGEVHTEPIFISYRPLCGNKYP